MWYLVPQNSIKELCSVMWLDDIILTWCNWYWFSLLSEKWHGRLLRLLDRRYVGIAKGVGQSMIVGRIHVAPLKVCATHSLAPLHRHWPNIHHKVNPNRSLHNHSTRETAFLWSRKRVTQTIIFSLSQLQFRPLISMIESKWEEDVKMIMSKNYFSCLSLPTLKNYVTNNEKVNNNKNEFDS